MIRHDRPGLRANLAMGLALAIGTATALTAGSAAAQDQRGKPQTQGKPQSGKPDPKATSKPDPKKAGTAAAAAAAAPAAANASPGVPFGGWSAHAAGAGKARTCYAVGKPTERKPDLKRDPAYLFISTRPGENVRNEVSFVMGFDVKADSKPSAQIGSTTYELVAKGANLWLQNVAKEGEFVSAVRKGGKLTVKAPSARGNVTTDTYVLTGLGQALERVQKDCP